MKSDPPAAPFALLSEVTAGELRRLADAGELASPLAHEFNNYLNSVLLHVAVLETEIGEDLRSELMTLRRMGLQMASLIQQFHDTRGPRRSPDAPADLNAAVRVALARLRPAEVEDDEVELRLRLSEDVPPVAAHPPELERLCTFLIRNAVAALGHSGGFVCVRTEGVPDAVLLTVEDSGPPVAAADLPQFFDLAPCRRPGTSTLELAACKSVVHRLGGKIEPGNRSGGFVIQARLPLADSA